MICKKCQTSFDDLMSRCPNCGEENISDGAVRDVRRFSVKIPDYNETSTNEKAAVPPEIITEKPEFITERTRHASEGFAPGEYKSDIAREVVKAKKKRQTASAPVAHKSVKAKDTIGDKFAASLIVLLVCILGVMMVVLTAVSVKTDIFKPAPNTQIQTVALSGLSDDETASVEAWLQKMDFFCKNDFNRSQATANDFLLYLRPYDEGGLYKCLYSDASAVTEADPADYFRDEEGFYSYYRLPEENVDAVLSCFGVVANHTVNTDDIYYYGGNYYFRDKSSEAEPSTQYVVDVVSSKKIQDGSFYVECNFYNQNNLSDPAIKRYAIVEKNKSNAEGEQPWIIRQIRGEAIFDATGVMTAEPGKLVYEMKTETMEKKASDGTVYHRFVIEYPVFSGTSEGERNANQLFADLVNSYRLKSDESAQTEYEAYTKNGGINEELPLITHIATKITYNADGYLSIIEEEGNYVPASMKTEQEEAGESQEDEYDDEYYEYYDEYEDENYGDSEDESTEEQQPSEVKLCGRIVEGYTFEIASGDFVTKDTFIGKDYLNISELLYRLDGGYKYEDLIYTFQKSKLEAEQAALEGQAAADELTAPSDEYSEEEEYYDEYEDEYYYEDYYYEDEEYYEQEEESPYENYKQENEIPDDELYFGSEIYESAGVLCKDGFMFCYVDENGIVREVVIPYMSCLFLKQLSFVDTMAMPEITTTAAPETTSEEQYENY